MRRFGDVRAPILPTVLGVGLIALALAGCSSSKKATPPATTTSSTASSSTTVPETSTSASTVPATSAPTTSASSAPPPTTARSTIRITGFTVSPASPICNSPTMIQLGWTATGATSVDLSIDGKKFATYKGGAQSHLEYFACDGKAHTYLLTALGPAGRATASKVVRSTSTG